MCAFEEEINLKKKNQKMLYLVCSFLYGYWLYVPSIEGDRIIPLYTNSLTLQRQSQKWLLSFLTNLDKRVIYAKTQFAIDIVNR